MKIAKICLVLCLSIFLSFAAGASCNAASKDTGAQKTNAEQRQARGQIKGILLDYESSKPIAGYQVCLFSPTSSGTPAAWEDVVDLKVETTTSKAGAFNFDKLAPGRYVFLVKYKAYGSKEAGYANIRYDTAKIIEVKLTQGQVVDLGKTWTQLP